MMDLFSFISSKAKYFKQISLRKTIRIVSHFDCDGICAAAILVNAMKELNLQHIVSTLPQLTDDDLLVISKEDHEIFIFSDLGSGQADKIDSLFKDKTVFILDHHHIPKDMRSSDNVIHINPHLFGIEGSYEISGSGVAYLFAKELAASTIDKAYLPVVGAIGDVQDKKGFSGINKAILDEAISRGLIEVSKEIGWFGIESRPLLNLLSGAQDLVIPGISGSREAAQDFLREIHIPAYLEGRAVFLSDLSEKQKENLADEIIKKRAGLDHPEDIFKTRFILLQEKEHRPTRDAKEFSTLLNACGRLGRSALGIGICLGDKEAKKKAPLVLEDYKAEIVKALQWYDNSGQDQGIYRGDNYVILDSGSKILYTIIGTFCSIVSNTEEGSKFIMSMGLMPDGSIKVSLRHTNKDMAYDLKSILEDICSSIGEAQVGGHRNAAGASITKENRKRMIEEAIKRFSTL